MNSYLITNGTSQERLNKTKDLIRNLPALGEPKARPGKLEIRNLESHPDFLFIHPSPSIGIAKIKDLKKFLSRKPMQAPIKAVIIPEAEKLTLPAQNAFLKTLEEPPANSLIILCAQNQDQLLPTIVSRCQLINLIPKPQMRITKNTFSNHYLLITKILKSRAGERLILIEPYTKNRQEAIQFCQEMIIVLREVLINKKRFPQLLITHYSLLITLKSFQSTINFLNKNINVKLAMDNLVLNLPKVS